MLWQQILEIEAALRAPSNNQLTSSMYSEKPTTSLPALSSSYVFDPVAQSTRYFLWEKLNGQNYFCGPSLLKWSLKGATSLVSWQGRSKELWLEAALKSNTRSCGSKSADVKYKVMSLGICEEVWLQKVLSDLRQDYEVPMKLLCDNKAAISIANNLVHHEKTKHVEIDRHFIKDRLASGSICIPYITSSQPIVDTLTKGLLRQNFDPWVLSHLCPNLKGRFKNSGLGSCWKLRDSWDLFCSNFLLF